LERAALEARLAEAEARAKRAEEAIGRGHEGNGHEGIGAIDM
jgi:hypothetical protein